MSKTAQSEQVPNFEDMLVHFKEANERAEEIHEENEQAAFYQESIPDEKTLDLTMEALALEQQSTVDEIAKFIKPELYEYLANRYGELCVELVELKKKESEVMEALNEEETRLDDSSAMLLRSLSSDRISEIMDATHQRKVDIKARRTMMQDEVRQVQDEINGLQDLFEIVSRPWPVPYIRNHRSVDLGKVSDGYEADLTNYLTGYKGTKPEKENWESTFSGEVDSLVKELDEQNLLPRGDVKRGVITNINRRDTVGTTTGLDRIFNAGLISKERRNSLMMGPFEVVCNHMFNTHKNLLGKGPRQKRAAEILRERLENYFAANDRTTKQES